jgi:hypothetical protein
MAAKIIQFLEEFKRVSGLYLLGAKLGPAPIFSLASPEGGEGRG